MSNTTGSASAAAEELPLRGDSIVRWGPRVAVALVALGFFLRLRGLGDFWLNPDEGIYYAAATDRSLARFWSQVSANAHPPAYYLLLHGLAHLTWDFVWLRSIALIFGTAAIWIFFLATRELGGGGRGGTVAGLVTAGLLAVDAAAVTLSQELRPYTMLLALLGLALYMLLRYRRTGSPGALTGYVVFMALALLTHYSAIFVFCVFCVVVGYFRVSGQLVGGVWKRIAWAQALLAALVVVLYVVHLRAVAGSDLMEDALGAGGWLTQFLIASPADAWRAVLRFQAWDLPSAFQVRSILLLLIACLVALASKDRTPAILPLCGLSVALTAAWLGLYPLGQSRHNIWLVAVTLPTFGWLAGWVTEQSRRTAIASMGALTAALALGSPIERLLGAEPIEPNSAEEQILRTDELAPLVVTRLDPTTGPGTILMSEQTYNVLMPLYAGERQESDARYDTSQLFSFPYGGRRIFVAPTWDWTDGFADVLRTVALLPPTAAAGPTEHGRRTILLVAGGWGSGVFPALPGLARNGVILGDSRAVAFGADGGTTLRVMAVVLDLDVLAAEGRVGG